jgi:hypothetical protein
VKNDTLMPRLCLLLGSVLLLFCSGCTAPENSGQQAAPARVSTLRDFSGYWEKNYQLSDDFNTRFRLYIADVQRRFAAAQGRGDLQGGPGARVNTETINGLARFTEELTRMPLLEILQDDTSIDIERDNDFTLHCAYEDRQFTSSTNVFGADSCGWDQDRLIFRMNLAGGLTIAHQFSMNADATMLNITTQVSSASVAVPLVISNYYLRYEPPEEDYNCLLTLTRNRVCAQRGTPK